MCVTRISPCIYNNTVLSQLLHSTDESLCRRKDSLFMPVLLAVTKPCLCGRMWEEGMDRLVLLKKEPDRRVFAVSRAATWGKRLTFQLHLKSLSPHAAPTIHTVKLQPTYLSIRCLLMSYVHTYIYTYINKYIHIYLHTYIHTHIHTYIHTYIYSYIHIHVHTHITTFIHALISTHTYTYML